MRCKAGLGRVACHDLHSTLVDPPIQRFIDAEGATHQLISGCAVRELIVMEFVWIWLAR